ncbi:MAG: TetR/AcrR family transcriptional regulator [Gammaproteobacteria bacterium]|nr:TetR/AcrR family transcriptional regulator [Gammaproteobacteria bacterium]
MSYLAERRLEERERRRTEILDAAEAVASVVGLEHMTMEQVARKARLSRALVYVYFRDKPDLLTGISIRALEQLNDRFVEATSQPLPGIALVEACGRAYVAFAKEFPVRFEVLAHCEAQSPGECLDPADAELLRAGARPQATLSQAIETGMRDGSIRREIGEPTLLGFTLWGLMHGLIQISVHKCSGLAHAGISADALIEQGFRFAFLAMTSADAPVAATDTYACASTGVL